MKPILVKIILLLSLTTVLASMTDGGISYAQTTWSDEGEITRSPWQEKEFQRIEFNGTTYTFMKRHTLLRRFMTESGGYDEDYIDLSAISAGQRAIIRHQANRIYELIIIE